MLTFVVVKIMQILKHKFSPWVLHSSSSRRERSRTFMLSDGMWTNHPHWHFYTGTTHANQWLICALPCVQIPVTFFFTSIVSRERWNLWEQRELVFAFCWWTMLEEDQLRLILMLSSFSVCNLKFSEISFMFELWTGLHYYQIIWSYFTPHA